MVRNATAVLLAATLALAAPASNLEIPASVLAQEARSRAAFTPAEKARASALEARLSSKMSINDVNVLVGGETTDVMFVVLVDYLKFCQKEARDARKIADAAAKQSLAAKAGKLEQEKAKIEAMKREAEDRFDHAMSAAQMGMVMGIVSCAAAAASAVGSGLTGPHAAKAPAGVAPPAGSPVAVRVVSVPSRTPTKTPGAGK